MRLCIVRLLLVVPFIIYYGTVVVCFMVPLHVLVCMTRMDRSSLSVSLIRYF